MRLKLHAKPVRVSCAYHMIVSVVCVCPDRNHPNRHNSNSIEGHVNHILPLPLIETQSEHFTPPTLLGNCW